MKGSYAVKVVSKRGDFQFSVNKKVTVLCGDSGTGKSLMIERIKDYNDKIPGIIVYCDVVCIAIEYNRFWKSEVTSYMNDECILFMDEDFSRVLASEEFIDIVKASNCYYVLVTRKNVKNLFSNDDIGYLQF